MKRIQIARLLAAAVAATALAAGLSASSARADSDSGTFIISDTTLMGCHAAGTLNGSGSISVLGGCAVLPDSAPGGGVQVFTGGTWSGDAASGVTVCFTFATISGPVYPTPFCVGPLPANTGSETIPDPSGGTGTTFIDITVH